MISPVVAPTLRPVVCSIEYSSSWAVRTRTWGNIVAGPLTHCSTPALIAKTAYRKLFQLHTATRLVDLNIPPANRLEALKSDRKGQWSIRINDQYRLCFRWQDGDVHDVEFVDYH